MAISLLSIATAQTSKTGPSNRLFQEIAKLIADSNDALARNSQGSTAQASDFDSKGFRYMEKSLLGPNRIPRLEVTQIVWSFFDRFSLVHDGWQYGMFLFFKTPTKLLLRDGTGPARASKTTLALFSFDTEAKATHLRDLLSQAANLEGAQIQNRWTPMPRRTSN